MTVPGLWPSGRLDPSSRDHAPLAPPFYPDRSNELALSCQPAVAQNSTSGGAVQQSFELSGNGRHATPGRQAQACPLATAVPINARCGEYLVAPIPGASDRRQAPSGSAPDAASSAAMGAPAGSVLRTHDNLGACRYAEVDELGVAGLALALTAIDRQPLIGRVGIKSACEA
jgi:hypothetical protein